MKALETMKTRCKYNLPVTFVITSLEMKKKISVPSRIRTRVSPQYVSKEKYNKGELVNKTRAWNEKNLILCPTPVAHDLAIHLSHNSILAEDYAATDSCPVFPVFDFSPISIHTSKNLICVSTSLSRVCIPTFPLYSRNCSTSLSF